MNIINSKEAKKIAKSMSILVFVGQDQNIQAFTLKYREEEVSSLARGADSPRQQCRLGLLTV